MIDEALKVMRVVYAQSLDSMREEFEKMAMERRETFIEDALRKIKEENQRLHEMFAPPKENKR